MNIILAWSVAGAWLTVLMPVPANKKMFWIQSIVGGFALWIALYILYLLRKHLNMEFSFWKGE
jgi:hypothetical protein